MEREQPRPQCGAPTRRGQSCSRPVRQQGQRCWQHKRSVRNLLRVTAAAVLVPLVVWGGQKLLEKKVVERKKPSVCFNALYRYGLPYGYSYFHDGTGLTRIRVLPTCWQGTRDPISVSIFNDGDLPLFARNLTLNIVDFAQIPDRHTIQWKPKGVDEAYRVSVALDPSVSRKDLLPREYANISPGEGVKIVIDFEQSVPGIYSLEFCLGYSTKAVEDSITSQEFLLMIPEYSVPFPPLHFSMASETPVSEAAPAAGYRTLVEHGQAKSVNIRVFEFSSQLAERLLHFNDANWSTLLQLSDGHYLDWHNPGSLLSGSLLSSQTDEDILDLLRRMKGVSRIEAGLNASMMLKTIAPTSEHAWLWERLGDINGAEVLYENLARIRPYDPFPKLQLAQLLVRKGQYEQAKEQLREVLSCHSSFELGAAYSLLADVFASEGNKAAALVTSFMAIKLVDPLSPTGWLHYGVLAARFGEHDEARRAKRVASSLGLSQAADLVMMAEVEARLGNIEDAATLVQRAYAMDERTYSAIVANPILSPLLERYSSPE